MSLYDIDNYSEPHKIKIAAYYFRNWENYKMQPHSHGRIEIMYVAGGKCSIEVIQNEFLLTAGDMILIDAGISHRIKMDDERCRMMNLEFMFEKTVAKPDMGELLGDGFLASDFFRDKKEFAVFSDGADIYPYISTILSELSSKGDERLVQLQAAQILIKTAHLYDKKSRMPKAKHIVYINKAIDYIKLNYHEEIMAEDVAKASGMNKNYLQRKFREHTGYTIANYINRERITKAKQLLENTDIPIADLCLYVGINSRQYFTALFSKLEGISPQKYRKNFLNSSWE